MTQFRRWAGLGLCALAILAGGCNILSLPFFLAGPEPSDPASLKQLATEDKNKKIKVAVLAVSNLEVREQLARVDRELSALVVRRLGDLSKTNEENVVVVPVNVVERYKSEHPDWDRPLDLVKIGQDLKVRYVIYLEIEKPLAVPGQEQQGVPPGRHGCQTDARQCPQAGRSAGREAVAREVSRIARQRL